MNREPATIYYWDIESVQSASGEIIKGQGNAQKLTIITEENFKIHVEYSTILKVN